MATEAVGEVEVRVPTWTRDADRVLGSALREVPLLAAVTPRGGMTQAEIVASFEAGQPRSPGWTYAPLDPERGSAIAAALDSIGDALAHHEPSVLARAYAARAYELALEALLATEVGTAGFAARARLRFAPDATDEATKLAEAWVRETEPEPTIDCTSDGEEPTSLASRLREEIGKHLFPFRVLVSPSLAPLAATGQRVVLVAAGRTVARVDVERTVLHELEGHVRPRVRASILSPGLFAVGSARGADDQEGLALLYEERHGFLVGARRRELALRHRAVLAMDDGATFVETVQALVSRDHAPLGRAVAAASRAFRGSAGETAGLGRERVYLSGFARVAACVRARPVNEVVLASGQVAVDAVDALARYT